MKYKKYSDGEWRFFVNNHRLGIADCIASIRSGKVDEALLDKLSNFCQTALMLMDKSGATEWQRSENKAELANYLNKNLEFKLVFKDNKE